MNITVNITQILLLINAAVRVSILCFYYVELSGVITKKFNKQKNVRRKLWTSLCPLSNSLKDSGHFIINKY